VSPCSRARRHAQELPEPTLAPEIKAAFDVAFRNISAFHAAQRKSAPLDVETMPGVRCRRITRPIGACRAQRRAGAKPRGATQPHPPHSPNASSCVRCAGAVGLYVPGGSAVLPSTALMLAVPAQIAGCPTGT
jgi:histidinol dehydrogenase